MVPDWSISVLSLLLAVGVPFAFILLRWLDPFHRPRWVDRWYGDREEWWNATSMTASPNPNSASGPCAVCSEPCTLRCGRCKATKYCSEKCQRQHWKEGHKRLCKQAAAAQPRATDAETSPAEPNADRVSSNEHTSSSQPESAPVPKLVLHPYSEFLEYFGDKHVFERKVPVGLRNLGNTCFANSVLQCLLHTRALASFLRSHNHKQHCVKPSKHAFCLLCELEKLLCEYLDATLGDTVAPKALLSRLPKIARHMVLGRQEDAHEFYVHLVDVMEAIMLAEKGGKEQFDQRTRETTFVHHLFGGYVRNRIVCDECGRESRTFESTMQLELAISSSTDNVEAALKKHFSDEILDGDNKYHCEKCKKKVRAVRGQRLEVAPNVLVICLKRFDSGSFFHKNNKPVRYKQQLDVSAFLADDAIDMSNTCLYKLYGVVVHLDVMNSTGSGHYLSYVRPDGTQWYQCNDSAVRQTSPEKALDPRAYMLFYMRQVPHTGPVCGPPHHKPKPVRVQQPAASSTTSDASTEDVLLEIATPGPQSHPIPALETRVLSSTVTQGARLSTAAVALCQRAQASLVTGDESSSSDTAGDRAMDADAGEVASRPLTEAMSTSSTSDSMDSSDANDLSWCIKGRLGKPGVIKLLVRLGSAPCSAKDVQVVMSGPNHVLVHLRPHPQMDFDLGDGVVIDELNTVLVKKRNLLKITCTLSAAASNHPPPTTPQSEKTKFSSSMFSSQTCDMPEVHEVVSSHVPLSRQHHSNSHHQSRQPASSRPLTSRPLNNIGEPLESQHAGDVQSAGRPLVGLAEECGESELAEPASMLKAPLRQHKAREGLDCLSWPASVGSEPESLELANGHLHGSRDTELGTRSSSSYSMPGAHAVNTTPVTESPSDSDHTPALEDAAPLGSSAAAGKKRRKERRAQGLSSSSCSSDDPLGTATRESVHSLNTQPATACAAAAAAAATDVLPPGSSQQMRTVATSHILPDAEPSTQGILADADGVSSCSGDSDTSHGKRADGLADTLPGVAEAQAGTGSGGARRKPVKGKKGHGKKNAKKKARKH